MLLTIMVVVLCATQTAAARTHRVPKISAPVAKKVGVTSSPEKNRHPEDVALDRKIKGICRGC